MEEKGQLTIREVIAAQEDGDAATCRIIDEAIRYLAIAMANMANLMCPSLILVDAYMMKSERNRMCFLDIVHSYLFGINEQEIRIEFKENDRFSGCKGSVAYVIEELFINTPGEDENV